MGDLSLTRAIIDASPAEKKAAYLLLKGAKTKSECDAVALLLMSGRNKRIKAKSDKETDHRRRLLVGPRLPRETVELYRTAATERGLSLYAWAAEALAAHYKIHKTKQKKGIKKYLPKGKGLIEKNENDNSRIDNGPFETEKAEKNGNNGYRPPLGSGYIGNPLPSRR